MANKYKRARHPRVFEVEAYIRRYGFVAEDIPKVLEIIYPYASAAKRDQ